MRVIATDINRGRCLRMELAELEDERHVLRIIVEEAPSLERGIVATADVNPKRDAALSDHGLRHPSLHLVVEGEEPDDLYYVVEDRGDRMVVSNFTKNKDQWNTNPLIGQNEWAKFMFEKQDSNIDDMNKKIMDHNLSGRDDRSLNDFNLKNVNDHTFRNMCIELHGHVETNIKGVSKGWKQALKSGKALDYLRNKAGMSDQEIMKFKDKYKL